MLVVDDAGSLPNTWPCVLKYQKLAVILNQVTTTNQEKSLNALYLFSAMFLKQLNIADITTE